MGYSILELVLRRLREANYTADIAYPGQKFPQISDTVATVHIEKVDRANPEYVIVEQDDPSLGMSELECAKASRDYLRNTFGI